MLQTADSCAGIIPFLVIFVVIIINVLSSAQKSGQPKGGGTLFDALSGTTGMTGSTGTSGGFDLGGSSPYSTPIAPVKKSRPPINWNIIRLNMTQDQIAECFDMTALSRGVKKADLPQYVNLRKLRSYFSDAQLADMIDLDFFDAKPGVTETASLSGTRQKSKLLSHQPTISSELPHLKHIQTTVAPTIHPIKPKLKNLVEEETAPRFSEDVPRETVV